MKRKKLLSLFLAVVMVVSTITAAGIQIGATLLPIKSVSAKVTLSGYTDEELKEIPLGTILDNMEPRYSGDDPIVLNPEDAVLMVDNDVYSEVDRNTVIDFSPSRTYYERPPVNYSKTLTLVIGSGKQLDPENIRYNINVSVTKKYSSEVEFKFYYMENGERKDIYTEKDNRYSYFPTYYNSNAYYHSEYSSFVMITPGMNLYAEADAKLFESDTHTTVEADVDFICRFNTSKDANGQLFNSKSDCVDIVYSIDGNEVYTDRYYLVFNNAGYVIRSDVKDLSGNNVTSSYSYSSNNPYQIADTVRLSEDSNYEADDEYNYSITELYVGNSYRENIYGTNYVTNNIVKAVEGYYTSEAEAEEKEDVKEQLFSSGCKVNLSKITHFTLFFKWDVDNENETAQPINIQVTGYKYNSNSNSNSYYYNDITVPVPSGNDDPWFRVRSASAEGYNITSRTLDTYYSSYRGNVTDTYYSYGYQTMFIYPKKDSVVEEETTTTEEEVTTTETETTTSEAETTTPEPETTTPEAETTTPEAETTTPEVETTTPEAETTASEQETTAHESETQEIQEADEAYAAKAEQDEAEDSALSSLMLNVYTNGVNIYDSVSGAPVDFTKEPQDFTFGTVQYTVAMEEDNNKTKNYFISIVQPVAGGAKLYVNGPEEREVYFDDYFDERHDILIANIGDEPLTGLNAELIDAQNVKLDGYWNVGGEKNDTLQAFTSASSDEMENLAKIRLVPDGEGEVKGTLKITADGQEPVLISLIGHAGNPKIVTESPLKDAVKYVPYRAIIANDNIHEWNTVTYSYYGNLPKGVSFNRENGEIYGTPQETGTFKFSVSPRFSSGYYTTSYVDFELTVLDNTNDNVFNATDENYEIKTFLGREATSGAHDYVLGKVKDDQLFVSNGDFGKFIDLWLNGQRLEKDKDYNVEEGSTRIVIFDEVFDGLEENDNNTIAAEFREGSDLNDALKRTAQNFKIDVTYTEPSNPDKPNVPGTSGGSSSENFVTPDNGGSNQGSGNQGDDNNTGNTDSDNSDVPENPVNIGNPDNNNTSNQPQENQSGDNQNGDGQDVSGFVNISASVVDENGNALAGLSVELHSVVKTAVTDESGKFVINSAEFGSHTLILTNEAKGIYAEKKFDLVKSKDFAVTDDTVTAPDGTSVSLNMVVDGNTIRFVQETGIASDVGNVNGANEDKAVPTGVAFPACVIVATLSAMGLIVLNIRRKH